MVFSYLRRDSRRPSSPAAHSSPPQSPAVSNNPQRISIPPQLPAAAQTPTFTDTLVESGIWAGSDQKSQSATEDSAFRLGKKEDKDKESVSAQGASSTITRPSKPRSVDEIGAKPSESTGDNVPSPVLLHPDHHEKPPSPWCLTFGKNGLMDSGKAGSGYGKRKPYHDAGTSPVATARNASIDGESPLSSSSAKREVSHDETPHSRPGKTRLNLLNPLTLLARRRSGQPHGSRSEDVRVNKLGLPALPDDYDPRIRGKLVHDFSVPRPRSNVSTSNWQKQPHASTNVQEQSVPSADVSNTNEQPSPNTANRRPSFGEQFENGRQASQDESKDAPTGQASPPRDRGSSPTSQVEGVAPAADPKIDGKLEQEQAKPADIPLPPEGAARVPSNPVSRSSTTRDSSQLPKHLRSSASRFSFDMAGVESSSQEKLLEEKHKEKEAARKAKIQESHFDDSDPEDFDYAAMMDDDGLEERIPGVNAEAEDDDDGEVPGDTQPSSFLPIRPFVPVLPPLVSNPVSPLDLNSSPQPSPGGWSRDAGGAPSQASQPADLPQSPVLEDGTSVTTAGPQQLPSTNDRAQQSQCLADDDFYFDDGMFDDFSNGSPGEEFDESIFDDETSHLYDRKIRVNPDMSQSALPKSGADTDCIQTDDDAGLLRKDSAASHKNHIPDVDGAIEHAHPATGSQFYPGEDLTEGNLKAYHSALAQAANQAALKGRFERSTSVSEASLEHGSISQTADSQPELTADQSRISQNMDSTAFDDYALDDFDYNDTNGMDEDDAIIAAANAEILEYDDEEFYGQEFGFYARTNGACDGEPVLGGYFGRRGVEGITRNHSGRTNLQEPSLTPITERSEWSTRNSIVSLAAHQATHSSPPLAQLVDMGCIEDEMSLSALVKLRRGAFGGSNGSLRSSAASPTANTSPATGQQQLGSISGGSSNPHDGSPKSGMLNSSSGIGDSLATYQSDESSAPGLAVRRDMPATEKGSGPPPLSVDTVRANASGGS